MKLATEGQFLELFAKLLTGVKREKVYFDQIQKNIKDPETMAAMFTFLINNGMLLPHKNLVVATRDKKEIYGSTRILPGDVLAFDTANKTVSVHRTFQDENDKKGIYFKYGNSSLLDDKEVTELTGREEILLACSFHASFIDCTVEQEHREGIVESMIYVKFKYF